ncbi:MAG: chemotaxis protein CheR, partial [Ramlibacter sp.]|nr:chemotaxis protein CheR [Ramlibacter sp.]
MAPRFAGNDNWKESQVKFRISAAVSSAPAGPPTHNLQEVSVQLAERDFTLVRQLISEYAGIKLSAQKRNMVYNRLLRRLRAHGVDSFAAYLELVQADSASERQAFVNALT